MESHQGGGTNLSRFDYTYYPEGEIETWSKLLGTASSKLWLEYDNARQLKNANNAATLSSSTVALAFDYDLAGNRTSDSRSNPSISPPDWIAHEYEIDDPVNQINTILTSGPLVRIADRTLTYDGNGNMTSDSFSQTYEWDAANRLVAINYPYDGKRSEFAYDGGNRRTSVVERGAGRTAVAQPLGTDFSSYSTTFSAVAGNYVIRFEGLDGGSDNAVLVDAVIMDNTLASNGSFETPGLSGTEFERYNPSGASWTFAGSAGVARSGGELLDGNTLVPLGNQVGFVQGGDGLIEQTVTLTAGAHTLAFSAAQGAGNKMPSRVRVTIGRAGYSPFVQRFLWDGTKIAEERDSTGAVVKKRFFAEGEQRWNEKLGTMESFYYTRDHLGSIREVTDASGNLRARSDYDVWGNSAERRRTELRF